MKKKNVTIYYGLIMAVYSLGYVAMVAFSSVYLLDIGLSNGQVGILLAVGSLLSVLFQPVIGSWIDRSDKVSARGVLTTITALILMVGVLILILPDDNTTIQSLLYGMAIMLLMIGQPFLNALGVDAINSGYEMNLGVGRSLGSLGYALSSYVFGIISVKIGPRSVPVAFAFAYCMVCLMLLFYPASKSKVKDSSDKAQSSWLFLSRYKRFAVMLLGVILIYFSHSLINTFALQIVVPKGGNSGSMGTASAIAAGCELVTAFFFVWYMKRIRLNMIIKIAGVFFVLKTLFSLIVPSVAAFYAIQALQMFGWGFFGVGIVYYVNQLMGDNDKAKGQAYVGMAFTIASVLATFLGGNLIDIFGVNMMLIVGTIAAALGTAILWVTADDTTGVAANN